MDLKTFDVVCAIILHENKILAAKRSASMLHAGYWEFPGGKIEPNETAQQSLIREIKEELDCEIEINEKLPVFPYEYEDKMVILHPFICKIKTGKPIAIEHQEIGWFSYEEINYLDWLPADINIKNYLLIFNALNKQL